MCRMYIGEQLLNPSEVRLRLSTQLGVEHVVLDNRGTELVSAAGGIAAWDAKKLRDYRRWASRSMSLRSMSDRSCSTR
jgi:mannonate dehydratase